MNVGRFVNRVQLVQLLYMCVVKQVYIVDDIVMDF